MKDAGSAGGRGVAWLNALPAGDAEHELLACCGARAWARAVAAGRPYADARALDEAALAAFGGLRWEDVAEALEHHPRVGDRPRGLDRESAWSRGEQHGVVDAGKEVTDELHEANLEYERRFGHVFLIFATGLSAEQLLAALNERLGNDPAAERETVRAELLKITRLRLAKLLEHP